MFQRGSLKRQPSVGQGESQVGAFEDPVSVRPHRIKAASIFHVLIVCGLVGGSPLEAKPHLGPPQQGDTMRTLWSYQILGELQEACERPIAKVTT